MPVPCLALLRWQFELAWSLLEHHLERLEPEDFLWEPSPHCFTVRRDAEGRWVPDWEEPEPDPTPNPTIAWVTWHIGWWLTTTIEHVHGRTPPDRTEIMWPGDVSRHLLRMAKDGKPMSNLPLLNRPGFDGGSGYATSQIGGLAV